MMIIIIIIICIAPKILGHELNNRQQRVVFIGSLFTSVFQSGQSESLCVTQWKAENDWGWRGMDARWSDNGSSGVKRGSDRRGTRMHTTPCSFRWVFAADAGAVLGEAWRRAVSRRWRRTSFERRWRADWSARWTWRAAVRCLTWGTAVDATRRTRCWRWRSTTALNASTGIDCRRPARSTSREAAEATKGRGSSLEAPRTPHSTRRTAPSTTQPLLEVAPT